VFDGEAQAGVDGLGSRADQRKPGAPIVTVQDKSRWRKRRGVHEQHDHFAVTAVAAVVRALAIGCAHAGVAQIKRLPRLEADSAKLLVQPLGAFPARLVYGPGGGD